MTKDEMWNAVCNSDENYDGLFFYAVKTTGIFCRPSCKSKIPKKENICYFTSAEDAEKAGFRPCKRCRSDLLAYEPMSEIAVEVKQKLQEAVMAVQMLEQTDQKVIDIALAAGFSNLSAFNRFFKKRVEKRRLNTEKMND